MSKLLLSLILLFAISETFSDCVDRHALSDIDALVHKSKNSRATKYFNINFNLLDRSLTIDVTRANITELCQSMIGHFDHLEKLALINVNLSDIEPGAFQNLQQLKHLSLAVNHLKEIKKGVFDIASLEALYLSANEISSIEDGAFSNIPHLEAVYLDKNRIVQLKGLWFSGCPNIVRINLNNNFIERITRNSFKDLRPTRNKTIDIFLNRNLISEVDVEAFRELNPVNLYLDGNQIDSISDIFFSVKEHSSLSFNENVIECVNDDILYSIHNTSKSLSVLKNPLSCDCVARINFLLGGDSYGRRGQFRFESTNILCNHAGSL